MTEQLTFILNGEVQKVSPPAPTTTLLAYLRRVRRLTGTKEGCAEGDCGACTVVVGELHGDGNRVRYRAINACIQFLAMLEGKSVATVEHLAGPDGSLHPCQQAMVDAHASQCGFCTPGFVMSLYAAYLSEPRPSRRRINDLLAGNLCRCTGYGPIIRAAETMYDLARPAWAEARHAAEHELLHAIRHDRTVALVTVDGRRFFSPARGDELARIYSEHPGATLVAGASDVGLRVTKQHQTIETLIHIGRVTELQNLTVRDGVLTVGAAVTCSDAEHVIADHFPDFGELIRRFASTPIRNSATIGGNIANGSPIGDMPPALIALEAGLVLRRGDNRRRLPLEDFFLAYGRQDRAPGEFIEAVEVPIRGDPERLRCYKVSKRFDQDISAVCGCFAIPVENGCVAGARICFGGMAGVPLRARAVEAALEGRPWASETIAGALPAFERDYEPMTDMRASAGYRMRVAKNLLRKYFHETTVPLAKTRLVGRGAALVPDA